jgi:superfamily I DNA and RNA helicase
MIFPEDKFIATEPLDRSGEKGEYLVWERVQQVWRDRDCLAYWRYPIFSQSQQFRQEPDILICDRQLGLIIIEVKSISIRQITSIDGHLWQYQNFYTDYGNPYQQAENQLFSLLDYRKNEPSLANKITARAIVALPLITSNQWQKKGFTNLPSSPPIIFQDNLDRTDDLINFIAKIPPVVRGDILSQEDWELLLATIAGTRLFSQPKHPVLAEPESRGKVLQQLRDRLLFFDLQQERIAKQIPQGMQRIKGIAGSGKTVLLCQKAAHIHLKHPEWKIALVFFSRSLYQPIIEQVDRWLRYFSNNECGYINNSRLLILHAWGSRKQPGFYSTICRLNNIQPLTLNDSENKQPQEALAEVCLKLLEQNTIVPYFDAILIDEGQDLISLQSKYLDKQPFYWLAYQALRSIDPLYPQQKRLIWAYDESQCLEQKKIATAGELLGKQLSNSVTGKYSDGINKSEILTRCYRTPHPIVTCAHALGMGLLRPEGMLTGISKKEDWEAIGYEVRGELIAGQKVTIERPIANSPNPLPQLWQNKIITFNNYPSRQQELNVLAANLLNNLKYEGLRPCQEILVLIVGNIAEAKQLEKYTAQFLLDRGLDIYIPSHDNCNVLEVNQEKRNPDRFWCEGAITISCVHNAKGNEADMVYIIGLDLIAKDESNIILRDRLFVALTRARAWVSLSGVGQYPMYREIRQVLASKDTFTFTYQPNLQREIYFTETRELLHRYQSGERNFDRIDLTNANLANYNLEKINLVGANLRCANLENTNLDRANLTIADLQQSCMINSSLRQAKLIGANLSGVNLTGADLTDADLTDADLTDTNLNSAKMQGVEFNC